MTCCSNRGANTRPRVCQANAMPVRPQWATKSSALSAVTLETMCELKYEVSRILSNIIYNIFNRIHSDYYGTSFMTFVVYSQCRSLYKLSRQLCPLSPTQLLLYFPCSIATSVYTHTHIYIYIYTLKINENIQKLTAPSASC